MRRILAILQAAVFGCLLFVPEASGQTGETPSAKHEDDVVVFDNGDLLTGEILGMQYGILQFKSKRATGTLELDWTRVVRLQSRGRYEFESKLGIRRIGRIRPDPEPRTPPRITLLQDDGTLLDLSLRDIVGIREMRRSFLGRIDLSVEGGITYTHASDQIQVNTQASVRYDHSRYAFQLQGNSLISSQSEGERTSRHELQTLATRYHSNHWSYIVLGSLLNDQQQDLDLRAVAGGGFQRYFWKTNRTLVSGYAGAVYTSETYASELDSNRSNAEVLTGIGVSSYRFRGSELNGYICVFPSVSDPGRVRVDANAYVKWEIVGDLYWKISFFENYDSRPPEGTTGNNFGLTSTVGWTF